MVALDIDLPKCCAFCPLHNRHRNKCNASGQYLFAYPVWESRHDDCPLIDVKSDESFDKIEAK